MLSVFYDAIAAEMLAINAFVVPLVGEENLAKHEPPPRVIFIPVGDKFSDAEGPGGNPLPIKTALSATRVVIQGRLRDHCEGMRDQVVIAVHRVVKKANAGKSRGGRYTLSDGRWVTSALIAKNGFQYELTFAVAVPIVLRKWEPLQEPDASTYTLPAANTNPTVKPEHVDPDVTILDETVEIRIVKP